MVSAAKLHAGRGSRESGEQEKILRVEKIERGEIDDGVHFFQHDLAAQRAEQAEKAGVGEREKKRRRGHRRGGVRRDRRPGRARFADAHGRRESWRNRARAEY